MKTREREGGEIQAAAERIDRQSGYVVIDFRGCDSREVSEIYQAFALLCAREKVRRALLKAGDADAAEAHYALRDTLVTLARIAGIPLRFRLALVASSRPIEQVYSTVQDELCSLGCDARVFRLERHADQWLRGAGKVPVPAPAAAAVPG